LLTGLAKCHCGYALISFKRRRQELYRCSRKHAGGACDFKELSQADLDAQVLDYLQQVLPKKEVRERILRRSAVTASEALKEAQAEAKTAREKLGGVEEQEKRIGRDYRTGDLTIEEYRSFKRELEEERRALQQAITRAEELMDRAVRSQSVQEDWGALLEQMDSIDTLSRQEQKQILRKFVKKLQVTHRKDEAPKIQLELVGFEDEDLGA
jgi:hypothetical protein